MFGVLNRQARDIADSPVSADQLGGLIDLIADGETVGVVRTGADGVALVHPRAYAGVDADSRLSATIAGNPGAADTFNIMQTHPRTADRIKRAIDQAGELVYIAPTRVNLQMTEERWPDVEFLATREQGGV